MQHFPSNLFGLVCLSQIPVNPPTADWCPSLLTGLAGLQHLPAGTQELVLDVFDCPSDLVTQKIEPVSRNESSC